MINKKISNKINSKMIIYSFTISYFIYLEMCTYYKHYCHEVKLMVYSLVVSKLENLQLHKLGHWPHLQPESYACVGVIPKIYADEEHDSGLQMADIHFYIKQWVIKNHKPYKQISLRFCKDNL